MRQVIVRFSGTVEELRRFLVNLARTQETAV